MYIYIISYILHYIYIWATVNIWYIAPSHPYLKSVSVLSFFRFWYISKCYRFLKSVLSFSKPQLNFQKIKMSRILLSINLNFGCSSYIYNMYHILHCIYYTLSIYIYTLYIISVNRTFGGDLNYRCPNHNLLTNWDFEALLKWQVKSAWQGHHPAIHGCPTKTAYQLAADCWNAQNLEESRYWGKKHAATDISEVYKIHQDSIHNYT